MLSSGLHKPAEVRSPRLLSLSPSKLRKILYRFWGESLGRLCQNGQGTRGSKSHDTVRACAYVASVDYQQW